MMTGPDLTLDQLTAQLALARTEQAAAALALDELASEIEQYVNDRYGFRLQDAKNAVSEKNIVVRDLADFVRDRAVRLFVQDSTRKKLNSAVTIKEYTVLVYDSSDALEFARQHVPKALKLDKRTFEKAARVLEPDFVTVTKEPRATIASDLSAWLPQEGEPTDD
jgi:hypothetical protein